MPTRNAPAVAAWSAAVQSARACLGSSVGWTGRPAASPRGRYACVPWAGKPPDAGGPTVAVVTSVPRDAPEPASPDAAAEFRRRLLDGMAATIRDSGFRDAT